MSNDRTPKSVSFANNEYENRLLAHATKPEHGPFSQYVKRLIEADRRASFERPDIAYAAPSDSHSIVSAESISTPNRPPVQRHNDDDKEAARSLL